MTKPSRPKRSRHDATTEALLEFVEALLDEFFSEPANRDRYVELAGGGRENGPTAGDVVSIGSIELSGDGLSGFAVRAGSPEIMVTVTHPRFNADITVAYELARAMVTGAEVTRFEGDRKQARKWSDTWVDEIFGDDDDGLEDELRSLLSGDDLPFEGKGDPGEPPPPSDQDRAMVETLAAALAREMKLKKPDMFAHQAGLLELEQSPQALWPVLDGMVAARIARPRDDAMVDAWQFLLVSLLTLIRYRIDRGWYWAQRMVGDYQRRLIEISQQGLVSSEDFAAMAGAMGEAGIEVSPEIRVALANAGLKLPEQEQAASLSFAMRGLMDEMASVVSSPFEAATALGEATKVMPSELRCFMAHEFVRSSHAMLRDTVPLMLLSEEQEVRRAAADALKETAAPNTMSPESLRRLIVVRNWVPAADRPSIDLAIRAARTKGVDCAQWPPPQDLMITASMIDGSGAQSLILTSRGKRKGVLAGMLLKSGSGVTDCWCDIEASRRDITGTISTMRLSGMDGEVGRAYLDNAVQNAIAAGTTDSRPPGNALLQIAELVGGSDWRDQRLDIAVEAKRLFDALPGDHRSPAAVDASLKRSGAWMGEDFAQSWFTDDAETRAIIKRAPRRDTTQTVRRLIEEAMPKSRADWAERFLLLALRAGSATDREHKQYANDFTVLAHSLCGDRDLATIPLMVSIARHTVEVARFARW